ncbi:MAG: CDP-alcohol phosphatidyltransferase family protein [Chitinophagales bacterium]|nr:CDP-alcohol phosphatidyltransferase family protein [Chitinophagales bacterium]
MPNQNINSGRKRYNILKDAEQKTIAFLCSVMPEWVTPNILTAIGFLGSVIVALGLWWARGDKMFLLVSIAGFAIQWFGDSLDGRLAYWRNIPRKWYGWSLDITVDWISIGIIGFGFYFFFTEWQWSAFLFIFAYGWAMINALLRYRITDAYVIDSGIVGPTELRILICIFLLLEIFIPGILLYFALGGSIILISLNMKDLNAVLDYGDQRDKEEKSKKSE